MNTRKSKQADWQCGIVKEIEGMSNNSLLSCFAHMWMVMGMDYVTEEDSFELETVQNELTKRLKEIGWIENKENEK